MFASLTSPVNFAKVMRTLLLLIFLCIANILSAQTDSSTWKRARKLAHRFIIVDGHVDLPYRLRIRNYRYDRDYLGEIPITCDYCDFDYKRAKVGGLSCPFMSIYIPSEYEQTGGARQLADSLIDMIQIFIRSNPSKFASGGSTMEVYDNFRRDLISLPMGIENGAAIEDNLANLSYFYKRGVRYMTLTHWQSNLICDSSRDTIGRWKGVSPFGQSVIKEMNRLGMLIDVSHISDAAFWQVMELTKQPVIASHSSCRAFTPGFMRNMTDEMLLAMKKNGGVVMVNFGTSFLDSTRRQRMSDAQIEIKKLLDDQKLDEDSPEGDKVVRDYGREHPEIFADVSMVANHIDHIVQIAGIDHVGLGSDFDGVGDALPAGLKDVSGYPNLIAELLNRGYSEKDIEKICYKNFFRVWSEVE